MKLNKKSIKIQLHMKKYCHILKN